MFRQQWAVTCAIGILVGGATGPARAIEILYQTANTDITLGLTFGDLEFENPFPCGVTVVGYYIYDWRDADHPPTGGYDDWSVSSTGIDGCDDEIWLRSIGQYATTSTLVPATTVSIHLNGDSNDGTARVYVDGTRVADLDMCSSPSERACIVVGGLCEATHTIKVESIAGGTCTGGDVAILGAAALGTTEPSIACCYADGFCANDLSIAECEARGGVVYCAANCSLVECPIVGACCYPDDSCVETSCNECLSDGGAFMGTGIECIWVYCEELVACCFPNGSCQDLDFITCAMIGGLPLDPNSYCSGSYCEPQVAACCFGDGGCAMLTEADCLGYGGAPQGWFTTCSSLTCPQPGALWTQLPTLDPFEPGQFEGWAARALYATGPIVAADWRSFDARPITEIYWWGAYEGWADLYPPTPTPKFFQIALWSGDPAGQQPAEVLEGWIVPYAYVSETAVGECVAAGHAAETCFAYGIGFAPSLWFYPSDPPRDYWLSIAAIYCACDGDMNGDGSVDLTDFMLFTPCIGQPPVGECAAADVNCDGVIDVADTAAMSCLQSGGGLACCDAPPPPPQPWGWVTRRPVLLAPALAVSDPLRPASGADYVAGTPVSDDSGTWDVSFELRGVSVGQCAWDARIGNPGFNGNVYALAVYDYGAGPALYAGGDFDLVDGKCVGWVARWDGTEWNPVAGTPIGSYVQGLDVVDVGAGPRLVATGSFTRIQGQDTYGIAWLDGQLWAAPSSWGTIDSGFYWSSAAFDGALFAGGYHHIGGGQVGYLARCNGDACTDFQPGLDGVPFDLVVFDDGTGPALYAGGGFTHAAPYDLMVNHVARWDGLMWSTLGQGMDGDVRALCVFDDGNGPALYAGGEFTIADGLPAAHLARWDGFGWTEVDGGTDGPVYSLCTYDDGDGATLIVGGAFTMAGAVETYSVAKWDGAQWLTLGASVYGTVFATIGHNDGDGPAIFAGGMFYDAGYRYSSNIAKWRACADCNHNSRWDALDIADGWETDCDWNGRPDACDLADGISTDCNENGVLDVCDIASGTSTDYNTNDLPDECDPRGDLNGDGSVDGDDWLVFEVCQQGPGIAVPGCQLADLDGDNDVDLDDAAILQDLCGESEP